jgi:biotin carboxylase
MRDAKLRTDFHITSGFQEADMEPMKYKSAMKAYYTKAGVPAAQYHLVDGYEDTAEFLRKVGYPAVAKPDNGVGANNTYKVYSETDLQELFGRQDMAGYILEPFVKGYVQTYDAILNSKGEAVFESSLITPVSCMDTVSENTESLYYAAKDINPKVKAAGQRVIAAYGVRSRFVHLEFFVLTEDQDGLGRKGDVVGLEVNMRPAGGTSPDMYNYASETDVFKIWADMIAFDCNTLPMDKPHHYCPFIGRRDYKNYKMDHEAIMQKYGFHLKICERAPDALSALMANQYYIATFDTEEELWQFYTDLRETW